MSNFAYVLEEPLTALQMTQRIKKFNSRLHAVCRWRQPDESKAVRLLVKDNIGVEDYPTSAGSFALRDFILPDAFCIQQIRKHSDIDIFGKTNLTELAGFVTANALPFGYSELGGRGVNPHGAFPCGGSSSGSAIAVAAGFCDAALGTETRGSLMVPGLRNGVFAFKPTRGTVSRSGIIPLSSSFDAPGVIARNAATLKKVSLAMMGLDKEDAQSFEFYNLKAHNLTSKRIIFCLNRRLGDLNVVQTRLAPFFKKLKQAGFQVELMDAPQMDFQYSLISSQEIRRDMTSFLQKYGKDTEPKTFEELVQRYRERPASHPFGMERLEEAAAMPRLGVEELRRIVKTNTAKAQNLVNSLLNQYNADFLALLNFEDWFSIGGGPSATIPIDFSHPLPLSLMLGARRGEDFKLLEAAEILSALR